MSLNTHQVIISGQWPHSNHHIQAITTPYHPIQAIATSYHHIQPIAPRILSSYPAYRSPASYHDHYQKKKVPHSPAHEPTQTSHKASLMPIISPDSPPLMPSHIPLPA